VLAGRVATHLVAYRRGDVDAGNSRSIFGGGERQTEQQDATKAHLNTIIALKLAKMTLSRGLFDLK
jgi:hypothetical protein